MKKRGQQTMAMPFGMIFAIFLIVVFVVIAFIAIQNFLDIGASAGVGQFYEELQDSVNDAWSGQSSDTTFKINLPNGITKVCFADLNQEITGSIEIYDQIELYDFSDSNVFLIPPEKTKQFPHKLINHLDMEKIIAEQNPYCVNAESDLKIKKGFYDKLVLIK